MARGVFDCSGRADAATLKRRVKPCAEMLLGSRGAGSGRAVGWTFPVIIEIWTGGHGGPPWEVMALPAKWVLASRLRCDCSSAAGRDLQDLVT